MEYLDIMPPELSTAKFDNPKLVALHHLCFLKLIDIIEVNFIKNCESDIKVFVNCKNKSCKKLQNITVVVKLLP